MRAVPALLWKGNFTIPGIIPHLSNALPGAGFPG